MRKTGWLSAGRVLTVPPKYKVRKGDTVVVIAGKDRGKSGKVLSVLRGEQKVTIEKVNIIKRHTKPNQQNKQGGILEREAPIQISNVMIYCATCQQPVRAGSKVMPDGSRVRVCKNCGQLIASAERAS